MRFSGCGFGFQPECDTSKWFYVFNSSISLILMVFFLYLFRIDINFNNVFWCLCRKYTFERIEEIEENGFIHDDRDQKERNGSAF